MRDQYAGDISDLLKFAFLRTLANTDKTLGVAWYYAPGDDGRAEPIWRRLDEQLCANLSALPERSIAALERAAIWPEGSLFHRQPMPPSRQRNVWGEHMYAALHGADIVFLDPDNGLGKEDAKHATMMEIGRLRRAGRAIVFITFPGRNMKYDERLRQIHGQLKSIANAGAVVTIRTNVSVPSAKRPQYLVQRPRWFTIVDPDAALLARAHIFVDSLNSIPRVRATLDCANGSLQ